MGAATAFQATVCTAYARRFACVPAHMCLRLSLSPLSYSLVLCSFSKSRCSQCSLSQQTRVCVSTTLSCRFGHICNLFGQGESHASRLSACLLHHFLKARLLFLQDDRAMTRRKRTTSDEDLTVGSPGCYLPRLLHKNVAHAYLLSVII